MFVMTGTAEEQDLQGVFVGISVRDICISQNILLKSLIIIFVVPVFTDFAALYSCATVFFVLAAVGALLLFFYYAKPEECLLNKIFIGVNAGLCVVACVIASLPCVTEREFVCVYQTSKGKPTGVVI